MKENKIRKGRRQREEERPGRYKGWERVREKVGEGRKQGWGRRLQKSLVVPSLCTCQDLSSPISLGQTSWSPRALQCSLPWRCQLLSWLPTCPQPWPPTAAFIPLIRENQNGPHGWPHAWPTDCKLFLKECLAMGFPSPGTILGMSIASVWNKNAESIFLINTDIVISCHSDGR